MLDSVNTFCRNLYEEAHLNSYNQETTINNYEKTIANIITDYDNYKLIYGTLLGCIDNNSNIALPYEITTFFKLFKQAILLPTKNKFDTSILEIIPSDNAIDSYRKLLSANNTKNSKINIVETEFDTTVLSTKQAIELISVLIDKLETDVTKKVQYNNELLNTAILELTVLHSLCKRTNRLDLFYHAQNIFVDVLHLSEYYQIARDYCEGILQLSFKDNMPHYGFVVCMRVYSNTGAIHQSLIYANAVLNTVIKDKVIVHDKFLFEIIWLSIKLYRTTGLYAFVIDIYNSIPNNMLLSNYERHSIDLTYFTSLLKSGDSTIHTKLIDYLGREREAIIKEGDNGCMPWLILLYNIRRIIGNAEFNTLGFVNYISIFEQIVPEYKIKKYKDIIDGTVDEIKSYIKESLLKVLSTRNTYDFVYDNKFLTLTSSRLLENGIKHNDIEAVLLSSIVLTDYSLFLEDRNSDGFVPLVNNEKKTVDFYKYFDNPKEDIESKLKDTNTAIIYLLTSENKLYQLLYNNNNYTLHTYGDFLYIEYKKWAKEIVPNILFDTNVETFGIRQNKQLKDYEDEEKDILDKIVFPKLKIPDNVEELWVIKDIDISRLPHNLLLNERFELIHKTIPITNIMSTKLISPKEDIQNFKLVNDISLWVPTEAGDITLQILHDKLTSCIEKFNIKKHQTKTLNSPLSSSINIISSHGTNDIATKQAFHINARDVILNPDVIIGSGEILILLVCHSGTVDSNYFKNESYSLAKEYIKKGYKSVIAPFWSLHIDIPNLWLNRFFLAMKENQPLSNAVFLANQYINKKFPTPSAWACMHLYGNPY